MTPRPIWILIPDFYPGIGGEERQAQGVSKDLIGRGQSVRVITRRHGFRHSQGLSGNDSVEGIPVVRVFSRGIGKFASMVYVLGALWHLALHGRGSIYAALDVGAPGWVAVIARYLLRGRSVVKLRSGRLVYEKRSWLARWQFCKLLHFADRVIVVNRDLERFLKELGIPDSKVAWIPNGVDCTLFRPVALKEKIAARRLFGLAIDKTIVLFVGRLEPVKGTDVLLRAWARLSDRLRADSLLLLIGDGAERHALLSISVSLDIHQSVILTGAQQSVHQYYAAADIFVLPSRSEGMPLALLEAMACGLPVVASNVGGMPDFVVDGGNGALFESENPQHLAQKLAFFMGAPNRWTDIGAKGRQTVKARAEMGGVVDSLQELYAELR